MAGKINKLYLRNGCSVFATRRTCVEKLKEELNFVPCVLRTIEWRFRSVALISIRLYTLSHSHRECGQFRPYVSWKFEIFKVISSFDPDGQFDSIAPFKIFMNVGTELFTLSRGHSIGSWNEPRSLDNVVRRNDFRRRRAVGFDARYLIQRPVEIVSHFLPSSHNGVPHPQGWAIVLCLGYCQRFCRTTVSRRPF